MKAELSARSIAFPYTAMRLILPSLAVSDFIVVLELTADAIDRTSCRLITYRINRVSVIFIIDNIRSAFSLLLFYKYTYTRALKSHISEYGKAKRKKNSVSKAYANVCGGNKYKDRRKWFRKRKNSPPVALPYILFSLCHKYSLEMYTR